MKVTVVGAGNVGATCADVLAQREIANEIDNEIIRELTRTINGGDQIAIRNVNADYLQRYLDMGENRA